MTTQHDIRLSDITIRSRLRSGDIGYITYLHGKLYQKEYGYGLAFEAYVASGLGEFYENFHPEKDAVWICEHEDTIIGFLLLMHRGDAAQLRYFILDPLYRGMGLGNKLMQLYMDFLNRKGYRSSYLLTTHELTAAAHLYKKHGFRLMEESNSSIFGKPLKQQRYELVLK